MLSDVDRPYAKGSPDRAYDSVEALEARLGDSISALSGTISGLETRLGKVLAAVDKDDMLGASPTNVGRSDLGNALADHVNSVQRLSRIVNELIDRIDV